jgi:hypothetical protein
MIVGMFISFRPVPELAQADHDFDRVTEPARLLSKILPTISPAEFIGYGDRGKRVDAAYDAWQAPRQQEAEARSA